MNKHAFCPVCNQCFAYDPEYDTTYEDRKLTCPTCESVLLASEIKWISDDLDEGNYEYK
jgi:hypothetical protein